MKRTVIAALGALAIASSAAAVPQYSQLRQDYPQINEAIAAATESDLHGTFGRLSALFNRQPIRDAAPDAGHDGLLPENFERNLEATLADLREDLLKPQLDGLTDLQRLDILQVVRIYAYARTIELWQSETFTSCPTLSGCPAVDPEAECSSCVNGVDDDPEVYNELQALVDVARPLYQAARNLVGDPSSDAVAPSDLRAHNFISAVEAVVTSLNGVESIDY